MQYPWRGVYEHHAPVFLYGDIDGEELLDLSVDDLVDCGVTAERDQKRILQGDLQIVGQQECWRKKQEGKTREDQVRK